MYWWIFNRKEQVEAGPRSGVDYVMKHLESAEENGCLGHPDDGESGPMEEEG